MSTNLAHDSFKHGLFVRAIKTFYQQLDQTTTTTTTRTTTKRFGVRSFGVAAPEI